MVNKIKNSINTLVLLTFISVVSLFFTPIARWLEANGFHMIRFEAVYLIIQKMSEIAGKLIWSG